MDFKDTEPPICFCYNIFEHEIRDAIKKHRLETVEDVRYVTHACGGCGGCRYHIEQILDDTKNG